MTRARFVSLTILLVLLLSGHRANAFPSWPEWHKAHVQHVYAVRWEDVRSRELWGRLLRNKVARSYHHFMALRPKPTAAGAPQATQTHGGVLTWENADRVADCEASGEWDINNGNGYWGALQFAPSTWFAWGGGPFIDNQPGAGPPFPYSREEQITVAAGHSLSNWPYCQRFA